MINNQEYQRLKEYYDHQRMIEFNREQVQAHAEEIAEYHELDFDSVWQSLWDEFDPDDYKDPPKYWKPKDPKWRIEGLD